MPARRKKGQEEVPAWDAPQWPLLAEQQQLQAAVDPAEVTASQQRCQTLLQHGYGALEAWLLSDPSPAEMEAMRRQQQAQVQGLAF